MPTRLERDDVVDGLDNHEGPLEEGRVGKGAFGGVRSKGLVVRFEILGLYPTA